MESGESRRVRDKQLLRMARVPRGRVKVGKGVARRRSIDTRGGQPILIERDEERRQQDQTGAANLDPDTFSTQAMSTRRSKEPTADRDGGKRSHAPTYLQVFLHRAGGNQHQWTHEDAG